MKRVKDVMTRAVVTVRTDTPFRELVQRMDLYRISALPVVDAKDRLRGIVSEADLLLKEERKQRPDKPHGRLRGLLGSPRRRRERRKASGSTAGQLMTSPVITVGPDASVGEAARTMHGHQVKRLIVVDPEARVIGVVSRRDLLKTFLGADAEIQREVVDRVIGEMLWLDPATIDVQVRAGLVTLRGQVERRSICPILVELVTALDGVVGVEDRLSYAIDDVSAHRLIA